MDEAERPDSDLSGREQACRLDDRARPFGANQSRAARCLSGVNHSAVTARGRPDLVLRRFPRSSLDGRVDFVEKPKEQLVEARGVLRVRHVPDALEDDPSRARDPFVIRAQNRGIEQLPRCGGPPLGLFPELLIGSGSTSLRPGDTLVLCTDGLTEAMNPAREMLGADRLHAVLRDAPTVALDKILDRLLARLEGHTAGAPLVDDVTVLMLRRLE